MPSDFAYVSHHAQRDVAGIPDAGRGDEPDEVLRWWGAGCKERTKDWDSVLGIAVQAESPA